MLYNFRITEDLLLEKVFPFFRFTGSHYQIGQQYGASCGDLIKKNLDLSLCRLQEHTQATREQILDATLQYRPSILQYAPFLDEEIKGITVSTGLRLEEVYFLQIRAEVEVLFSKPAGKNVGMECTTFALSGLGTADGTPLAGQNADLPAFYSEVCIVVEIVSDDSPPILMVTPAGQVSYIGMNQSGLCVFANFLVCDGWRIGFPRYCLSRLALTQDTVIDAEQILAGVYRASSRNLLMADLRGEILDLEFAIERYGRLITPNGRLIHSNHFISPELLDEERSLPGDLMNSHARLSRFQHLVDNEFGNIDTGTIQTYLRDRVSYPDPVCSELGDPGQGDEMTIASVIAEPAHMRLWAAVGPPSQNPYRCYSFKNE